MAEDKKPEYKMQSNPSSLANIKYDFAKEDGWSADNFFNWYKGFEQAQQVNVGTKEGLDTFYGWMQDPVAKELGVQQVRALKDGLVDTANSALVKSSEKNISGLVGILDKEQAVGIALQTKPVYDGSSDEKYVGAAKKVENAQNVAQDIQNAPDKYLEKRFEGLDETSKQIWSVVGEEILQYDLKSSQRQAFEAVTGDLSAGTYFQQFYAAAQRKIDAFEKAQKELQTEKQEAYKAKVQELQRDLTPYEMAELNKSFADKEKEIVEKNKEGIIASRVIQELTPKIMQTAYETQKAKLEEAKKSKKKGKVINFPAIQEIAEAA